MGWIAQRRSVVCVVALASVLLTPNAQTQSTTLGEKSSIAGTQTPGSPPPESASPGQAGDSAELAKQIANPIAALIVVPFQSDFDFGMGPYQDGFRYTLTLQPSIPFALNKKWNLISRTVTPIIHQSDVIGETTQTGLADTTQSFFLSPSKPKRFVWGLGPALLVPTATNSLLGSRQLAIGPTLVMLKQHRGWTVGALLNHVWSVAGRGARPAVNSTLLQPFLKYTTKTAWTLALNTETMYDWTGKQATVPIHLSVTKLLRFGTQRMNLGGGLRCWANSPSGGPRGCGLRLVAVPLFPKK